VYDQYRVTAIQIKVWSTSTSEPTGNSTINQPLYMVSDPDILNTDIDDLTAAQAVQYDTCKVLQTCSPTMQTYFTRIPKPSNSVLGAPLGWLNTNATPPVNGAIGIIAPIDSGLASGTGAIFILITFYVQFKGMH